jgi:hypothetical protein
MGSSAGPNGPTAASTNGSGIPWTNASNIESGSSSYAACFAPGTGLSNFLQGSTFGFAIPGDAVITGVVVSFYAFSINTNVPPYVVLEATCHLNSLGLVVGGSPVGTTISDTTNNWAYNNAMQYTYGSSTDLWGTSLSPAQVNASNFGVQMQIDFTGVDAGTGDPPAETNRWEMTVYYTAGEQQCSASAFFNF